VTVTVGRTPPVKIGAVHTLNSVLSGAAKWNASTKGSPDESDTLAAVALLVLHTPTVTTRRLPAVTLAADVTDRAEDVPVWPLACWTNSGTMAAEGVRSEEHTSELP